MEDQETLTTEPQTVGQLKPKKKATPDPAPARADAPADAHTDTFRAPTRGFLMFATTHPYFGRMAANLANSIRATDKAANIAVVTDMVALSHLNEDERNLFTRIIPTDEAGSGMVGVNRLRMSLPDWSPWDETIALDVDMLWLPKANPASVFALLDGTDFTIVNEGAANLDGALSNDRGYTHWADLEQIKEAYGVTGRLFFCRGEFVVFRKSDQVTKLYELAREIQAHPKIPVQTLAGSVTDEFALNIALNLNGMEPHRANWQPAFWSALTGAAMRPIYKLTEYVAISFGGHTLQRGANAAHDQIAKAAAFKTGVRFRFPLYAKRNFMSERRKTQ